MPQANHFRHQEYSSDAPFAKFELLEPPLPPQPGCEAFADRLAAVGVRFQQLGVTTIGLMHGTFVGTDAFGVVREIGRMLPSLSEPLRQAGKELTDRFAGESGNFTPEFAELFQRHLSRDIDDPIRVTTFDWSSENNHTGRADGAIRLIDRLFHFRSNERVLLFGHSHAGNVFAIVSNLLAGDQIDRDRFFDATESFYQYENDDGRVVDLPVWERVRNQLRELGGERRNIDFVTFGTPVRYGWDPSRVNSILHFVQHRPTADLPIYRVPFPPVTGGDIVQQVAVAGTDFLPYMLSRRTRLAERKLERLLQPGLRRRQILERLRCGQRVHADGLNLLVNYADDPESVRAKMLGHGVYTRREWLVFHAEAIAARLPEVRSQLSGGILPDSY